MKTCFRGVLTLIMAIVLLSPMIEVQAQSDEPQPLDDEFVHSLVMMAVNHNLMEGKNEVRDLRALRDFVSDYYDDLAASSGAIGAEWYDFQRNQLTRKIDEKINLKFGRDMIQSMLSIFTDADTMDFIQARQVVSGIDDPPQDYFKTMNSLSDTNTGDLVSQVLDIHTITHQPDIASTVAANSPWTYDLQAISESTAPIVSFGDVDSPADSGNAASAQDAMRKPLRFINNGFDAVTVIVASYTTAPGIGGAIPSASTVVFSDSSSGAYLDLPPGTYTFCYEWQLDDDFNNDGYFDYHHKVTSQISLTAEASDNPNSALTVTLNPDSAVSNPNGRCGQNLTPSSSGLTPEEAANAGSHTYLMVCPSDSWCAGESILVDLDISFSANNVTVIDKDLGDEVTVLTKANLNQYMWTTEEGETRNLVFNLQGFTYQVDLGDLVYVYTRQDGNSSPPQPQVQPLPDQTNQSGLTPQEAACSGTHLYSIYAPDYPEDGEDFVTYTITFSPGSAVIQDTYGEYYIFGGNEVFLEEVGENLYSYAPYDDYQTGTVTFTDDGFTTTWTKDGFTIFHTLQNQEAP